MIVRTMPDNLKPFLGDITHIPCHNCFQVLDNRVRLNNSGGLQFHCEHHHCNGTFRFCSKECLEEACYAERGFHTEWKCHRFQYLVKNLLHPNKEKNEETLLQVSVSNGIFPMIDRFTDMDIEVPLGIQGTLDCLPHRTSNGGCLTITIRLLPKSNNNTDEPLLNYAEENMKPTYMQVLMDDEVLECGTPNHIHDFNVEILRNSVKKMWMEGVVEWYNHQQYLSAIEKFEKALEFINWNDDTTFCPSSTENGAITKDDILSQCFGYAPPIRGDSLLRIELAESCAFLASCLLDMGETMKIQEAQRWLFRALRTIPKTKDDTKIENLHRRIWVELMLSCEEQNHMKSAQLVAQAAFEFASIQGWSSDGMQRPGYVYNLTKEEENKFHTMDHGHNVLQRKPFYFENDDDDDDDDDTTTYRPSWCKVLEDNYESILKDFQNLLEQGQNNGNNNGRRRKVGQHWPKVGSGKHRNSGQDRKSVV